jgi:hypothetical protein
MYLIGRVLVGALQGLGVGLTLLAIWGVLLRCGGLQ